jgi:FkbM family methyltransferase
MKNLKTLIRKILKPFNFSIPVRFSGSRIRIPLINAMGVENIRISNHEHFMLHCIRKFHTRGATFLDIGANIGQTLLKLKVVDKSAPYIGIEPNPYCLFYLQHLVKYNNFKSCRFISAGASDKTGLFPLHVDVERSVQTSSGATFIENYKANKNPKNDLLLACLPLSKENCSTLFMKKIGIIKVDIEGGEYFALNGLKWLIDRDNPIIILENLREHKSLPVRVEINTLLNDLIGDLNYKLFEIIDKNSEISYKVVKSFGGKVDKHSTNNFLVVPKTLNIF